MSTDLTIIEAQPLTGQELIARARELAGWWIEALDVGSDTRTAYQNGVEKFIAWLEQERPGAVTAEVIKRWRDEQEGSPATVNLRLSALRSFYGWTEEQAARDGQALLNPTAGVKGRARRGTTKRHKRDELTPEEVKAVLETCDIDTLTGARDRAIISLMAHCGLRTVEVHRANVGDLQTRGGRIVLWIQGKGEAAKDDFVVLNAEAERAVRRWLAVRPGMPEDPLFVSLANRNAGERLSRHEIRRMIKRRYREAGIVEDTKTTHSLRHSAISTVARRGTFLQAQALARHKDPKTTMVYYHEIDRLENPPEDLISY